MYEKNKEYAGVIQTLGYNGEGIIKSDDGQVAFIPYALVGESVRFTVLSVKKNLVYGKLVKVLKPASERTLPECELFGKCGGCQLQHMSYPKQLEFKKQCVVDNLNKIAFLGVKNGQVLPVIESDKPYGYRNKLQLPVGSVGGNTVMGFFAERSHRIVPCKSCPIHPEWAKRIIEAFNEYVNKFGVCGYDETSGKGTLKHIVARELDGRFIITVVINEDALPFSEELIKILKVRFDDFTLCVNVNKRGDNVVFGDKFITLYGTGAYTSQECGITFSADSNTFVQVNASVRKKLYERVASFVEGGVVIDAYSGGGLLTAMLAKRAKLAYGIEIVPQAVECANRLKVDNGLEKKIINICGAVEDELPKVINSIKKSKFASDEIIIVLDPPRKGIDRSVVEAVLSSGADKVIMVSCNPATLARDLGLIIGTLKPQEGGIAKNLSVISALSASGGAIRLSDNLSDNDISATVTARDLQNGNHLTTATENNLQNGDRSATAADADLHNSDHLVEAAVSDLPRYYISYIQPYDMFAQTANVETLVLLRTKSKVEKEGNPGSSNLK